MSAHPRPLSVVVVALGLLGLSGFAALAGLVLTAVSACCGSPNEPDGRYALAGFLVAGFVVVAAAGLWRGSMTRRALAGALLAVPLVCAVGAFSSSDLAAILPVAVLFWLWFWWFLGRPRTAQWLLT